MALSASFSWLKKCELQAKSLILFSQGQCWIGLDWIYCRVWCFHRTKNCIPAHSFPYQAQRFAVRLVIPEHNSLQGYHCKESIIMLIDGKCNPSDPAWLLRVQNSEVTDFKPLSFLGNLKQDALSWTVLQIHLSILKALILVLRDFTDTPSERQLYSFVVKGRVRVASSRVKP